MIHQDKKKYVQAGSDAPSFSTLKLAAQLFLLCIFSGLSAYAAGFDGLINVTTTILTFLLLLRIRPAFFIAFFLWGITTSIYFPIGVLYGPLDFGLFGSVMETDFTESIGFFKFIPWYIYALQLLYFLSFLYLLHIIRNQHQINFHKFTYDIFLLANVSIIFIFILFNVDLVLNSRNNEYNWYDSVQLPIISYYAQALHSPLIYREKKELLINQIQKDSTWTIETVQPAYKNYVLVIGESVRRDYLHAYGFPLANTPFLSSTKGLLIDGFISAGTYTSISIPPTLYLSPQQSHNNIITLANQAGFDTFWISNQGMLGLYANDISLIAMRSKEFYFTQRGDYQKSRKINDAQLLPFFQKVLGKPGTKPKLIVLHLLGSHMPFCDRIDEKHFDYINENLSCYASSIYLTDQLLEQMVAMLKQTGESYSLIYFADHGLQHTTRIKALATLKHVVNHNDQSKQSVQTPFARVSSDDQCHTVIRAQKSAMNFLKGFSAWTGIKAKELEIGQYDFFSPDSDNDIVVDTGHGRIPFEQLRDDARLDETSP